MNILLMGSGGREHALAWKLAQSPRADGKLYAAPGNPGIAAACRAASRSTPPIIARSIAFCRRQAIGLVVIGPEAPLVDGLADNLRAAGIAVFGPDKAAGAARRSRASPRICAPRAGIPTAGYVRATSPADGARPRSTISALPVVIKADGLAAGKGVIIAETARRGRGRARRHVRRRLRRRRRRGGDRGIHGRRGGELLRADRRRRSCCRSARAQDHKRVGDGDTGPNTGGMGAYSPAARAHPGAARRRRCDEIVAPDGRARWPTQGTPYSGVLYAGLMLTAEGPKLIEYNARFGDPECQVLMMRLEGDLRALLLACAEGSARRDCRAADVLRRRRADRGDGGERLSRHAREGRRDRRHRRGRGGGREGLPRRHRARRTARLVANGGRVLDVTARGATRRRGAGGRLSPRSTRSTSRPASAAATSAGAK